MSDRPHQPTRKSEATHGDRAVSEVLGYAMIFALIVTAIGLVTVGGLGSLQDARTNEQLENAKRAFDVLHDNMADVHAKGAPSRATEVALGDSEVYFGENVTVRVKVTSQASAFEYDDVRPVIFRIGEGQSLVYEAGATIQASRDGGLVLNEPPFTFVDDTSNQGQAHVPIVRTTAADVRSIGGTNVLIRGKSAEREVRFQEVTGGPGIEFIEIQSPRYEIWEQYFDRKDYCASTDADDSTDPGTAECVLGGLGYPTQLYVTHQQIQLDLID